MHRRQGCSGRTGSLAPLPAHGPAARAGGEVVWSQNSLTVGLQPPAGPDPRSGEVEVCAAPLAAERTRLLMKFMSQRDFKKKKKKTTLFSADFTHHFPSCLRLPRQPTYLPPGAVPTLPCPVPSIAHRPKRSVPASLRSLLTRSLAHSSTLKLFSVANQMSKQATPVIWRAFKQEGIYH